MITSKIKRLDAIRDFDGIIVDPDILSTSRAAGSFKVLTFKQIDNGAAFLETNKKYLTERVRGKLTFRYVTDHHSEILSQPDVILQDANEQYERPMFHIISQPYFEQDDYTEIQTRHMTARIFIPGASMADSIFRTFYVDKESTDAVGSFWSTLYTIFP